MTQKEEGPSEKARSFMTLAKLASVGLEMGVAVLVGWGVGYWLDKKLGTQPWLMLVFLLFGVAAGFKGMITAANAASKQMRKADEDMKATTGETGTATKAPNDTERRNTDE